MRLSGEVAWQDASGRTGIRFVDVPQASRRLMHAWLLQNSFRQTQDRPAPPIAPVQRMDPETKTGVKTGTNDAGLGSNRRGERRFPCKLGAELYRLGSTVPNRCTLSDISEGGCYVEMPSPLTGQNGVEIVVRTNEMKVKIQGQVLAVHPGFGMGVRFVFEDDAEREEVLRLLALLAAGPTLDELPRERSALLFSCTAFRKYSSDNFRPVSRSTLGSQPSSRRAFEISGRRCLGSSCGKGSNRILLAEPLTARIFLAHSRIVNSVGFPMFTGSCSEDRDKRTMPSISSLT